MKRFLNEIHSNQKCIIEKRRKVFSSKKIAIFDLSRFLFIIVRTTWDYKFLSETEYRVWVISTEKYDVAASCNEPQKLSYVDGYVFQ